MKWFNLLKSNTGKLVLKAPQLAALAGVGLLASYSAFQADKKIAEQEQIRSLSSLAGTSTYEGLRQDERGRLTSMNIRDGLSELATPEERASFERSNYGGGDFGLSAADNVGGSVSSSLSAAETSATEGLGMGRNATVINENTTPSGATYTPGVNTGNVAGRTSQSTSAGGADNRLTSTSVTRANGTGVNNASYGAGTTSAGGNGTQTGGLGGNHGREGYKLSGAMTGGTNPASLRENSGAKNTSSFLASSRNYSAKNGRPSGRNSGNDLHDIAKRSADAATNEARSNTEGGRAFLAGATKSGGMDIDSGGALDNNSASSKDFMAPLDKNLKSIGKNWAEPEKDKENKRDKDMQVIYSVLFGLIAASVMIWPIIVKARQVGQASIWGAMAGNTLALVLASLLSALWAALITNASIYNHKYFPTHTSRLAIATWIVGGACVAVTWLAYFLTKSIDKENTEAIEKAVAGIKGDAKAGTKTLVTTVGVPAAKTVVQDITAEPEDNPKA